MGDDEAEHETEPVLEPPISKRKAHDGGEGVRSRLPKVPRLDSNGTMGGVNGVGSGSRNRRLSSSSSLASPPSHAVPARTQPAPVPSPSASASLAKRFGGALTQGARGQARTGTTLSAGSRASTSDFPNTISQRVQHVREKEKEREREKGRGRAGQTGSGTRRELPSTARKHTVNSKNVRKVTTASLLKNAQGSSASFVSLNCSFLLMHCPLYAGSLLFSYVMPSHLNADRKSVV